MTFIAENEVISKTSQISRSLINFQGVPGALEMTFQIPALLMEFKDLHEPWGLIPTSSYPILFARIYFDFYIKISLTVGQKDELLLLAGTKTSGSVQGL